MAEHINKAELMAHIESEIREWGEDYDAEQILGDIEDFPAADVVERKHGEWIKERHPRMKYFQYKCSKCKKFSGLNDEEWIWKPNYCPNCGADMKNDADGN